MNVRLMPLEGPRCHVHAPRPAPAAPPPPAPRSLCRLPAARRARRERVAGAPGPPRPARAGSGAPGPPRGPPARRPAWRMGTVIACCKYGDMPLISLLTLVIGVLLGAVI